MTPARLRLSVCVLICLAGPALAGDVGKAPAGTLQVVDPAGKVVDLSSKEWLKLKRFKAEVKGKGDKTETYEGVSLAEVLRAAGISLEGHPRGRAASCVVVEGADGYRAVLALAEVDPAVADKGVILADRLDGKPLPEKAGPYRLVVPGDKLPVRWVRQVVQVAVRDHASRASEK